MGTDLEEIKTRLNIVEILGEYIRLEKAGSNWRALCPFHNEKSPSFMVSEDRQMWKCFGCGKGGDIFGFIMEIEGLEFREALKQLAEKAGVELSGYDPKKTEQKNRTLEILELATKWYEHQLWSGPGKTKILEYLHGRGLKDETIKEFRLGYAPKGWRNILTFLTKRGYKLEEIEKTGLLVQKTVNSEQRTGNTKDNGHWSLSPDHCYDRFRERIMFPICDYSGRVVGYSARVAPGGDESQAKYVNTPETEVYHKSHVLYGLDKAKRNIKDNDFVLLVEGNMDVIAASQAGIKNVVAVSGTALTPDQIKIIKRYSNKVKMFFDMDSAGDIATKKSVKLCLGSDMNVEVVSIPKGKDAADIARENPKELKVAVEKSKNAVEYLLEDSLRKNDINSASAKRKVSEIMVDIIGSIASAVEKNHWIRKIASALDTDESALTDEFKKANLKNRIGGAGMAAVNESEFSAKEKLEILYDELIALILVSREVWEEAVKLDMGDLKIKDSLLKLILQKGRETDFNFEKFIASLDSPEERKRAENIFFQRKYRLDLNNQLEEIEITDPKKELKNIVSSIKKEIKKKELDRIIKDLKLAEEDKNKEAINFLKQEFKKISQEAQELNS